MKTKESEFIATETLIVADIARSVAFYRDVLGARVLREGEPTLLRLKNIWMTINVGGGPTEDKPEVIASPPKDLNRLISDRYLQRCCTQEAIALERLELLPTLATRRPR